MRCRFGDVAGSYGTWLNSTTVLCEKPSFPDSYRSSLGSYAVAVTPNGQCFAESVGAFVTYNALFSHLDVLGAPSTTSVPLAIHGEGFVPLTGGLCRFTLLPERELTLARPLSVESDTYATCSTPAAEIPDAKWAVTVSLNGLTVVPNKFSGVDVVFTEYDLSSVRVTAVQPPGGPLGSETSVTVVGAGFAEYGVGQLKCRTGAATIVPGILLDSLRVLCSVPAMSSVSTLGITVSLNNATTGNSHPTRSVSTV